MNYFIANKCLQDQVVVKINNKLESSEQSLCGQELQARAF